MKPFFCSLIRCLLSIAAVATLLGTSVHAQAPGGVIPGQYIVVLKKGAAPAAVAQAHGLTREHTYSAALNGFAGPIPAGRLNALARDPRVASIEEDQVVTHFSQQIPTGIQRMGGHLNSLANIGSGRQIDIDVAIIDSGIQLNHPDLNVVANVNFAKGGKDGNDGNGHGTHVAGTVAALDNGLGVVGVAPGTRLWAVRVLDNSGSGSMSGIISGVDYVTKNADKIKVANMSLGCECTSSALNTAIANSVKAGVTYVVAAGNSNKDARTFSPANHPDVITVSALADFNGVGGGGAPATCRSDIDDTLANFSNWGPAVDIAAPGVCILSTWRGSTYNTISGTSMASPHVAGAAALYIAQNPGKSPAEVKNALVAAAKPQADPQWGFTQDRDAFPEPVVFVGDTGPAAPVITNPVVTILSPANNAVFSPGAVIHFEASVVLAEGAALDGLIWSSDLQGDFEEGLTATFSGLSEGTHVITALAQDDADLQGSATITITIANIPPDLDAPVISNVESRKTHAKNGNFEITWTTDEPATSIVIFTNHGEFRDDTLKTSHKMGFRGTNGVGYEYYVRSIDANGNAATSGPYFHQN
jgi:subtilisin